MTVSNKNHKGKEQEEGGSWECGGKIEGELSEVNTRAVSWG